jgi:hypothetical protein
MLLIFYPTQARYCHPRLGGPLQRKQSLGI